MANGNVGWWANGPAAWITVFAAGVAGIFKLGTLSQRLESLEVAGNLRVTKDSFEGLVSQVEVLHEDVREIRRMLESRRGA